MIIKTASFANEEHSAVVVNTEECGHVAISATDTPDAWSDLLAWAVQGNTVRAYGEGSAYKAARAREADGAARKAVAEKKLAALGMSVDDLKTLLG